MKVMLDYDVDDLLAALKERIGEDGILSALMSKHVPGSPESKALFECWGKLVDIQKSKRWSCTCGIGDDLMNGPDRHTMLCPRRGGL